MPDTKKKRPRTAPTAGGRTQEVQTPMPTRKANRVAQARNRAGLTQPALAARAGVSRPTIARIEAGTNTPLVTVALAISRELGETVEALFGGDR